MALRSLARHLRPLAPAGARFAHAAAPEVQKASGGIEEQKPAPTVFDKMVQFYVIDKSGARHTVRGIEGNTLAETLREYGVFGDEFFMPHPTDPANTDCHVYVGNDYLDKLNTLDPAQEADQASVVEDYVRLNARANSRMAYFIRLSDRLKGMTVALGPIEPWRVE